MYHNASAHGGLVTERAYTLTMRNSLAVRQTAADSLRNGTAGAFADDATLLASVALLAWRSATLMSQPG